MKNENRFIPVAETYELGPVLVNSFTETRIPLFWGPGLSMSNYPAYTPPDTELWRVGEPLSIPKTVRVMLGVQPEYDSDAYGSTDGGTTPPPPPDPPGDTRTWRYELDAYQYSLFDSAYWAANLPLGYPIVALSGDNFPSGPYLPDPYGVRATGYTSTGGPWPVASPPNIEIYNGFNLDLLYSGTIVGAPGIIITGSRNITWISDNHPFSPLTLYAYGNTDTLSPTIPPRCYYLVPAFSGPYWNSGEVPPAVRDFYGCPASPPPLPPP